MVGDLTPPHDRVPPGLATLADYAARAPEHLPPQTWTHIEGGADRGLALAAGRAAFDRMRLLPRVLRDLRGGNTAVELLGTRHAAPMLLAPIAYQKIAHRDGELAVARAAAAMGTGFVVSTLSSMPLEAVFAAWREASAALATTAPAPWFQLYLQPDRAVSAALVRRAEAAGYAAIVLTVDAAVKRADFALPAGVSAANLPEAPVRQTADVGGRILFGTPMVDQAPRWEDLAWLRAATRLPLIVKGVLHPDDAVQAVAAGADALIVSHHGGRVLDAAPSGIEALPAVAAAVAGRVPLLVDGGIRLGTDIAKALALGADAVLVGRPQMHGLAVAGMAGVAHILHILRTEYELAQAQLGCRTPTELRGIGVFR